MKHKELLKKYPFLSEIDANNLYIISKCKISKDEIDKLTKKELIFYTKRRVNKTKKINKDADIIFEPFVTPKDLDALYNYKKHGVDDNKLNKILIKLDDVYVSKYPNTKLILREIKAKKVLDLTVMVVCFAAFSYSSFSLVNQTNDGIKIKKISAKIQDNTVINEVVPEEEKVEVVSDSYFKYINTTMLDVDLSKLKEENNDTKGWIKVEGTNVNYPFVQAEDNEYYLKHSFDKTYNKKGWVFLDYRNNINELNDNTILYAHGLVDNAMFGSLRRITKPYWYNNKNNMIVKMAADDKTMLWEVFSTYNIEPESYYITNNISNPSKRLEFYNTLKERSVYDYKVELNENDKILTLSSCYDNKKRMVLHAKLISINK